MAEKKLIVNNKAINYEGIFNMDALFRYIFNLCKEKGYKYKKDRENAYVKEDGNYYSYVFIASKEKRSYLKGNIKIIIDMEAITDVIDDTEDIKELLQEGKVNITFDSWLITDYEKRYDRRPFYLFVHAFIHKYIYKLQMEDNFIKEITKDTAYIYAKLKSLIESRNEKEKYFVSEDKIKEESQNDIEEAEKDFERKEKYIEEKLEREVEREVEVEGIGEDND